MEKSKIQPFWQDFSWTFRRVVALPAELQKALALPAELQKALALPAELQKALALPAALSKIKAMPSRRGNPFLASGPFAPVSPCQQGQKG